MVGVEVYQMEGVYVEVSGYGGEVVQFMFQCVECLIDVYFW